MAEAGVREIKNHFSEYIRRARAGERVVITDRGRPVAAIVPLEEATSQAAWELVRQGGAKWNGGKPKGLENPPRIEGRRAEEIVLEDRR